MRTEWEATFWPIDKDEMRARLRAAEATLIYPERLMRRVNFFPPDEEYAKRAWVRVRDEGDRITMSLKEGGPAMEDQKERQILIDNFDEGVEFLLNLGCRQKNYQETRREFWKLQGAEITIDEWPFLPTCVEIEGVSAELVEEIAGRIGFKWEDALFCTVDKLYAKHYGIEPTYLNREVPRLIFEGANPFTAPGK